MSHLNSIRVNQAFRDKFAADLRRIYLPSLASLERIVGEEAIMQFFQYCMKRSEANDFALQGEIMKFSFISLHLGLYFDQDPLLDEVRIDALWGHSGVHPNVGLNRMFDNADLMIAEGLVAADQGFTPGFTDACVTPTQDASVAAVRDICIAANPKRAAGLGDASLDRALAAALYDLDTQHSRFKDYRAEWMICTYFLGHGFARNPLYAWVPWEIAEGGLKLVRRKFDG